MSAETAVISSSEQTALAAKGRTELAPGYRESLFIAPFQVFAKVWKDSRLLCLDTEGYFLSTQGSQRGVNH